MRTRILALALLLLGTATADAQVTPDSTAAPAAVPDSAHVAAASELVDLLDLKEQTEASLDLMEGPMSADNPMAGVISEVMKEFMAEHMPWEKVKPIYVETYRAAFTEPELRELIAFYQSPIGRKVLEQTPQITETTARATQEMMMPHMPDLQRRIMARMGGGMRP